MLNWEMASKLASWAGALETGPHEREVPVSGFMLTSLRHCAALDFGHMLKGTTSRIILFQSCYFTFFDQPVSYQSYANELIL